MANTNPNHPSVLLQRIAIDAAHALEAAIPDAVCSSEEREAGGEFQSVQIDLSPHESAKRIAALVENVKARGLRRFCRLPDPYSGPSGTWIPGGDKAEAYVKVWNPKVAVRVVRKVDAYAGVPYLRMDVVGAP